MSIQIREILCPTDFSECADRAAGYAIELAKTYGARIHLHHALYVPYLAVAHDMGPDVAAARETVRGAAERDLAAKAEELRATGARVETILTVGAPYDDVVRLAGEIPADLIVLATHGRGAIGHLLLGSTAERVVRLAPCPVLTVKHPEHEFPQMGQ